MTYVPLGIRTEYSFGDGACRVEALVEQARAWGLEAAGIADLNGTFGWVPFFVAARAAGIHPILGVTLHLETEDEGGYGPAEIQLLARNCDGVRNILQLVSRAHLENPTGEPRVHEQDLEEFAAGVLALDGGRRGPVVQALRAGRTNTAERITMRLRTWFGVDGFYAQLDRRRAGTQDVLDEAHLHLARRLNISLVAAPIVRGSDAAEAEAALFLRRTHGDATAAIHEAEPLLHERDLRRLYRDVPEAVANTCVVAALCRGDLALENRRPPLVATSSGNPPQVELREACERGARERYGVGSILDLPAAVRDRLAHELTVIEARELASCFLIVRDVVRHAKEEGIFVGPGRGSAAGSLVCYLIGITSVDPLQHGLSFQRFIGRSPAVPEFVLEVEREGAANLGTWLEQRVGAASIAGVASIPVLGHPAAMRGLAQLEGLPVEAIEGGPERALRAGIRPPQFLELHEKARRLEALALAPHIQPGSYFITPEPVTSCLAVARVGEGIVAQITLDAARALGLMHVAILPSRDLSVVHACCRALAIDDGPAMSDGDSNVAALQALSRGDAVTVPGFESGAMLHLLEQLEPQDFEDLVAVCALELAGRRNPALVSQYTAAVAGYVPMDADADVATILVETRGVLLYPEQVLAIAMAVAGMSPAEAESLRHALHHRNIGDLARGRAQFIRGGVEHGRSVAEAERLFAPLLRFDLHEFDKADACARVQFGLEAAALRAQHPKQYAKALLSQNVERTRRMREIILDAVCHGVLLVEVDSSAVAAGGKRRSRQAPNQLTLGFEAAVEARPRGWGSDALVQHAALWTRGGARPSSVLPHLKAGSQVRIAGKVQEVSGTGKVFSGTHVAMEDAWGRFECVTTARTVMQARGSMLRHGDVAMVHGRVERRRGLEVVVATRVEVATSEQGILFLNPGSAASANPKQERSGVGSRRPNAERRASHSDTRAGRLGMRRSARRADDARQEAPGAGFPLLGG